LRARYETNNSVKPRSLRSSRITPRLSDSRAGASNCSLKEQNTAAERLFVQVRDALIVLRLWSPFKGSARGARSFFLLARARCEHSALVAQPSILALRLSWGSHDALDYTRDKLPAHKHRDRAVSLHPPCTLGHLIANPHSIAPSLRCNLRGQSFYKGCADIRLATVRSVHESGGKRSNLRELTDVRFWQPLVRGAGRTTRRHCRFS
jgi:hypothetical protein